MKKLILLILLTISGAAGATTRPHEGRDTLVAIAPDLAAIRAATQDPTSPFYYPSLMQRYFDRDTTLSHEAYRHLYLGYTFQEDYDPYRISPYEAALDTLYNHARHTPEECKRVISYAERVLADNPFDLRRMAVLEYAHNSLGNLSEADFWRSRIHFLLDAINSTGDGRTPETAWFIIEPAHAYDLLNTLGVIAEAYEFRAPHYDYIQVYDLIGNARGFYFNVSRLLEEYNRKFGE